MPVNYQLAYLLSHLYTDKNGYMQAAKKAVLNQEETRKIQTFFELNPEAVTGAIKRAVCSKGTYELYTLAEIVPYRECFTDEELAIIDKL
jgi:hypothetical protein